MCGIVAVYAPRSSVKAETVTRAIKVLEHRGPDGQKVWVSPSGRVGLGHARLSIIDLSTGDQPIANENGDRHIIVNGEFYDYERIQRELEAAGHRLRTRSDSEIALHLYEDLGTLLFEQLRGEFAFVLWDERNQVLLAGRDRFGVKPLYYGWHEGVLYLASEAKALFAAGFPARWDHESFFQATQVYLEQDRSLFAGIYQVPPGHFMYVSGGHSRLSRYWDLDYPLAGRRQELSDEDHVARVRHELENSVRLRLRADVPVACYLSGGIDSCAVTGLAAHHAPAPLDVFTVCFGQQGFDEEPQARAMAERTGARFHPLYVTEEDVTNNFEDAVFHAETLPANENGVSKFLLSRMVRANGMRVVLTGEGGDELFAGYLHFRRDLLLAAANAGNDPDIEAKLAELEKSSAISRGTLYPSGKPLPMEGVRQMLGYVPSWLEAFSALAARMRRLFSPEKLGDFAQRDPYRVYLDRTDVRGQLAGREPLDQSMYLWTKGYLHNYNLSWLGDRSEMAHSVEARVPFLDHHVFAAARELPVSMRIRGGVEKYALREAARPFVLDSVYRAQKHPFTAPSASHRTQGRLFQMMQDVLRSSEVDSLPFFDGVRVRALLDELVSFDQPEKHMWGFPLTRVVGACLLQKRFRL